MTSRPTNTNPTHQRSNSSKGSTSRSRSSEPVSRSIDTGSESSTVPSTYIPQETSATSYLTYPVTHVASAIYRRLTEPAPADMRSKTQQQQNSSSSSYSSYKTPNSSTYSGFNAGGNSNVPLYIPKRTASPFAPPPLTGLSLRGHRSPRHQILTRTLAEEIRLLLPPRLQLSTDWTLAYSVETDGVSLATLYSKCAKYSGSRHGFVLVVKDSVGGVRILSRPTHISSYTCQFSQKITAKI
jgi:hypothetical protein